MRGVISGCGSNRGRRLLRTLAVAGISVGAAVVLGPTAGAAVVLGPTTVATTSAASGSCPWVDSTAPIYQRVEEVMARMSEGAEIAVVDGRRRAPATAWATRRRYPSFASPTQSQTGRRASGTARQASPKWLHPSQPRPRGTPAWSSSTGPWSAEQAGQGAQRRPGADHQHRARPALGPGLRELRRGPLPQRPDGGRLHPGRTEPGGDGPGQAFRRLQPGDRPQ